MGFVSLENIRFSHVSVCFHLPFELVLHLFGIVHGELRVGSRAVLGATGDVYCMHGGQTGAGEQVL